MAVSGTNTYSENRNDIIDRAYSILGLKNSSRALTAVEITDANKILNGVVKRLKVDGDNLWKRATGALFLVNAQSKYLLDGSTANATESYNETTTTAAAISGASSVDVTASTGMVVGYNIGIVQDDNTIHWTTIASISTLTIGLDDNLTAAAASGNKVYVYQTKITRPERISNLRILDSNGTEISCTKLAADTYDKIPSKSTTGRPIQFYYDKQLSSGNLYFFPTPNSVTYIAKFTFQKMFFDFTSATDSPDFPIEWVECLAFQLADSMKFDKSISTEKSAMIEARAAELLADMQGYDREDTSFRIVPVIDGGVGDYE